MTPDLPFAGLPRRWRLIDQPLSAQFLVAGGIVAFFSVVSLVLLLHQVSSQTKASRFLSQTHRTIGRLNTLGRDFYRQETALLEYLRTRDERFLATVREDRQLWDEGIGAIDGLTAEDPGEKEALVNLKDSYQSWIALSDRLMGKGTGADVSDLKAESALFKETFLIIDRLISSENRLLNVRDSREKSATQSTFTAIAAINVALLVLFGIVLAKLYFSIARPISDLSRGIQKYEDGDFAARVPVSNRSQIGYLEFKFNEMAEKIEAMVADLRKLDQLKTDFISTVSHELRTPLTSIGGYVKLLVSGDAGPVTETQKEFLYIIDTNVVRLTHLINDILDVEKMELGKVQIVKEPQDLASILKECRDTFGIVAAQKGLDLKFRVPDRMKPVLGDRSRLVQVFMNLLSNAIKYTQKGYVELEAEEHEFAVSVRVRDTGVGLTAEEKEKLFQKFYRTRSGLKSAEGGTGLGLVIVRGLIEAHGGSIAVDSEPGQGTTFTVTLPLLQSFVEVSDIEVLEHEEPAVTVDAPAGLPVRAPAPVPSWNRPVWIIDPDPEDVRAMGAMLDTAGQVFKGFHLRARSFASVDEIPGIGDPAELPALVVLDPGKKGAPEVSIPALRSKLHRTVPILVVSSEIDAAVAFAEGASALLTKPVGEREFLIAVKDLISAKGWRILVADRNTDLRILIRRALEQRGFLVDDVDRGSQVLGRMEQGEYDLALIDLKFSDVSGVEVLKAIRRAPRFKSMPVFVMLDGDKSLPSQAELESWGADHFVGKYRGIGGIVDAVCQYLEDRKLIEQPH